MASIRRGHVTSRTMHGINLVNDCDSNFKRTRRVVCIHRKFHIPPSGKGVAAMRVEIRNVCYHYHLESSTNSMHAAHELNFFFIPMGYV